MQDLSKISVVLPSLDPDEKLVAVIDGLLEYGFTDIILVNDGSKPENLHYFESAAARHPEIQLLHHPVNRGKGAALKTAFSWFLEHRPDSLGVVTVDGDNQHHPEDTRACALQMLQSGKVVLGCRDFSLPHVPKRSRYGNHITSWVFKVFCGMTLSDTQTGLRAIPATALPVLNAVYGDRFEYETNMLLALKEQAIAYEEVKIRTVYIEENKSSHFRAFRDSWRIYKLILAHFFRYTASAMISSVLELALFWLFNLLLRGCSLGSWLSLATTGPSRVISSVANFHMNKSLVFRSSAPMGRAMLRYYLLAAAQLAVQVAMEEGSFFLLHVSECQTGLRTVLHVAIMILLYFASYVIQQRWVFAADKSKDNSRG